ncbi:acyl-ACP--UDP-N-acetylglucosamine O-acyltransferase [Lentisphaera profundi]|uniref:Acyl-ACP--UDP-N-acetylglucosamine O-acyltransferase n=1 Tax=Lentisphaera profundi TaxID=1658616 RepID=A0ABY7VYW7_9BACT|nr:acyl-ACP--UDP-N-acetylglucosamine O-acyltransferase [Lentisphaera profundi]WDE98395.1 acyl-ACP--UDP-N-acetylglucosamine O-acyltransferase [Lentisphaera profundi]
MASDIHPQAFVHPDAKIGDNCKIGPFCTISENAVIGDNCYLQSHVVIDGNTKIGDNCKIYAFASIGSQSQDLKFKEGNVTYTEVGDNTIIREYVTIHSGTDDGTITKVGSNCALLALSHVGHNTIVGDHVVLSHNATLAGHVIVDDHVVISGLSAIHQFCKVGKNSFVAGMARVVQDVLPYTICEGSPGGCRIINKIGMERSGYDKEDVRAALEAYKIIFKRKLTLDQAVEQLNEMKSDKSVIKNIVEFCKNSERGLARPQ